MYCNNCGNIIKKEDKFCPNCGVMINQIPSNQQPQNNIDVPKKDRDNLGTISLILGIISLILSIFLNILILPMAIVGLILGIISKSRNGKKIAGIILNAISIIIILILLIIALLWDTNYISGKYDCTGLNNPDEFLITLHLNEDNTFLYGPYGDLANNYVKGTYTYEKENKTNASGEYEYYMVTLEGSKENFVIDGVSSTKDFNAKADFGITHKDNKKQGVIMFVSTYNTYYCYEK